MNYVTFSDFPTSIKMPNVTGTVNGYKLKTIVHGGRVISLAENNYYYIPFSNKFVSYKGTRARELTPSKGLYSFREKLKPYGSWHFKANVSDLHHEACSVFRG